MVQATSKEWPERMVAGLIDAFADALADVPADFAAREAAALSLANEVVRRWLERDLRRMAKRYGDEVVVAGRRYRRHSSGTRRYHTLCGAVEVARDVYRLVGIHNGPTVVPLELEARIVENATPTLATSVSQAFASMPLRHYEAEMSAAHRRVPSRSTLERIGKRIGETMKDELPVIEPVLRARTAMPAHARSISVGLDRTTIPMAEPATSRRRERARPYVRKPPPPVTVAFRMAYVATIAVHDACGDTILSRRFASTADEGPIELLERFGAELQHLRARAPKLPVIVIQDGAPELWALMEEWLENFGIPIELKLIDRYHLDERLAAVAYAVEKDETKRRRQLRRWQAALDRDEKAAGRICARLRRLIYGPKRFENEFVPIDRCTVRWQFRHIVDGNFGYFLRHVSKMRYATARRRGFPVGSGVTEGACKAVITSRFKRSGQRWNERGASTCLLLRTLHLDERLGDGLNQYTESRRNSLSR